MQVVIKEREAFNVLGKFFPTSLATQQPMAWWKSLRIAANQHGFLQNQGSYSLQKYPSSYFESFSPLNSFDYAPGIPLEEGITHPSEWEIISISGGLFAVFVHRGTAETFPQTMGDFFGNWLPQSSYELDDRIHFCFMPPDYRLNDPAAEEEIWIPIRPKK